MRSFTEDERAQRALDLEEVKKVLSKRSYLNAANRRAEELDTLWTRDHADTASYGRNWGYYVGIESIRAYYVGKNPFGAVGSMICHPFNTYKIHIAGDGKTAQVVYYSTGCETRTVNGELACYWDNARCACDLVRENDGWKIWHLFQGTDFADRPGEAYANLNVFENTSSDKLLEEEFGTADVAIEAYTAKYNYHFYPPITGDYETFADVVSSGPEGNPNYKA